VKKLFSFIGATALGYVGWFIGAPVGMTTAFIVSMVGSGVGMYYGRKIAGYYL
jgi:phosphate/sulfate permease